MSATKTEKAPKAPKAAQEPKVEKVRTNFPARAPAAILNADGKVTVSDPASHGYDRMNDEWLKRNDFANEQLWLTFKAADLRTHATAMLARADRMDLEAKAAAEFGDPVKRQQVKRAQKLASALADLRKQLEADGIDVAALLGAT